MTYVTLGMYWVAFALSASLCGLLLLLSTVKRQAPMLKSGAVTMAGLSVAMMVSAFGAELPRAFTAVGSNLLLLASAQWMHGALARYLGRQTPSTAWVGWGLVAAAAPLFVYWGVVEPNGVARSLVFSVVSGALSARTVALLAQAVRAEPGRWMWWGLAVAFGGWALGMAARVGVLLLTTPADPLPKASNPTTWPTVVGFMVVLTVVTASVIWMELGGKASPPAAFHSLSARLRWWVRPASHPLLALWALVATLTLAVVGFTTFYVVWAFEQQGQWHRHTAQAQNARHAAHTQQLMAQVDTVLHAVRTHWLLTRSVPATEAFINQLPFDRHLIGNVYLISPQDTLLIAHDPQGVGTRFSDRDYAQFHRAVQADELFVGAVETGRVTGLLHFRVSRRITEADGAMGGIVLATVDPQALSVHFQSTGGGDAVASLVGLRDRRLRATSRPLLDPADWQRDISSPLWQAVAAFPQGSYDNTSPIDQVQRHYVYQRVGDLPLVMVTGFSVSDVQASTLAQTRWVVLGAFASLALVLGMAGWLTVEIHRRYEQNSFLAMLSHELKTPLSVLRMALGQPVLGDRAKAHAQEAVHDMDALVQRLLQVDRLQQGGATLQIERCPLAELLAGVQAAASEPGRISLACPPGLACLADEAWLNRALANLVDNALKYSPAGSIVHVQAGAEVDCQRAGVRIRISNPVGRAGMPDPQRAFQKYYRAAQAHHRTGSGLGLYLVRTLVALQGGWVRLAPDAAGQTVHFDVWLPA